MSIVDIPLKQHDNIVKHATQLANIIRSGKITTESTSAARLVKRLLLEITSHLKVEDDKVYPRLALDDDPHVRSVGQRFQSEMGQMVPAVVAWGQRWNTASEIANSSDEFITDTRNIFKALKDRIEREEVELYPLLASFA